MSPGQTGHITGQMDVSPGQTGRTPGGVPPKFFMFIGFFLSQVVTSQAMKRTFLSPEGIAFIGFTSSLHHFIVTTSPLQATPPVKAMGGIPSDFHHYKLNSWEHLGVIDVIPKLQKIIPKFVLQSFWAQNFEFVIGTLAGRSL